MESQKIALTTQGYNTWEQQNYFRINNVHVAKSALLVIDLQYGEV